VTAGVDNHMHAQCRISDQLLTGMSLSLCMSHGPYNFRDKKATSRPHFYILHRKNLKFKSATSHNFKTA